MQTELDSLETLRPIQILGVNNPGLESGNNSMTSGRTLPWLQPATGNDVWSLWQVTYRDVVILGPSNESLGAFNLSEYGLSDSANYDTLKRQLLKAADE